MCLYTNVCEASSKLVCASKWFVMERFFMLRIIKNGRGRERERNEYRLEMEKWNELYYVRWRNAESSSIVFCCIYYEITNILCTHQCWQSVVRAFGLRFSFDIFIFCWFLFSFSLDSHSLSFNIYVYERANFYDLISDVNIVGAHTSERTGKGWKWGWELRGSQSQLVLGHTQRPLLNLAREREWSKMKWKNKILTSPGRSRHTAQALDVI